MGFKKIDNDELKTKISPNFLGIPIREGGKIVQKNQREQKIKSSYKGSISEVLILNEEFMEFQYKNDGSRKIVSGNGNISIFNNSVKDRIWDAYLEFSGSQFDSHTEEKTINLGIFEPSSNKVLKYEIINSEDCPDLIKINENIETLNDEIKVIKSDNVNDLPNDNVTLNNQKSYILLLGKENKINFSIEIINVSNSILEDIKFKKNFSNLFYDFEFKSTANKEFRIKRGSVECSLKDLNPGEKIEITIQAKIFPKKKENIKSGTIELTFNLSSKIFSGVKVNRFSAYSHAMHAIKKEEKNDCPNHWLCSLVFENRSDFKLKLKSILILDKNKSEKLLDLDFNASSNPTIINPHGRYETGHFDYEDEIEPVFSRKIEYTVDYKTESNSMITTKFEDSIFKVVNFTVKKKLSKQEIKSFEETPIESIITVKNEGTAPIKALQIIEKIPEDFLPSRDISDLVFNKKSDNVEIGDIELKIIPDDEDLSHEHIMEVNINLKKISGNSIIEVEDFLEMKYILKAITPDYQKAYDFPIKVNAFYPVDAIGNENYVLSCDLSNLENTSLNVTHKRRKLMIGKEIFQGRSNDEFAIYITARNGSNIKLSDVNITDTFPNSFELISSNIDHKIEKSKKNEEQQISFNIDSLLPYQEKEIMYYLKTSDGKDVKYSELESFFIG